ncbi:alpha/beta fold hydrolase [Brevibacterium zhoupengii]|uniref:alpha/beta fold hydrolase n=1 Tax=Brevibacterium zhoupengii TaxID=2898795 RepID=UPI001E3D46FB|nr:alpha/beta hydrolase [Brevibacterium zhoupengii]
MKYSVDLLVQSQELIALARGASVAFDVVGDNWRRRVRFTDGDLHADEFVSHGGCNHHDSPPDFALRATNEVWDELTRSDPAPGQQSVIHLVRTGTISLTGDSIAYVRHMHLVRAAIEALRGDRPTDFVPCRPLKARGEYHRVSSAVGTADVHVERCGGGPPIIALATAGSASTQWHGLMTESDLTDRFELITVDLPWHGSSSPTFGTAVGDWMLTPETYSQFIADTVRAIGGPAPVLLGVSMAGAAVVHAVSTYPQYFAGAVACQAGPRVRNRSVPQLRATDIDQTHFVPEWTYGLMNPASPAEFRKRVWWGYSSGGHGLYVADIESYQQWDVDPVRNLLRPSSPHIAVLSGSYDTTVPPEASRRLAEAIPNSSFCEMPELGHFPHAENPARFADYLEPALKRVLAHTLTPPDPAVDTRAR